MSQKPIQLEIFERGSKTKKSPSVHEETSEKPVVYKFPPQLCIKVVCSIILLIMSFALGVERGKVISIEQASTHSVTEDKMQGISKEAIGENRELRLPSVVIKKLENRKENDTIGTSKHYIVQVATYKKDSSYVKREAAKLEENGYSTLVIDNGNYSQICAGKFPNKKEANKHLQKLKQTYKDCFIRKI